jgi:hypothetical protein
VKDFFARISAAFSSLTADITAHVQSAATEAPAGRAESGSLSEGAVNTATYRWADMWHEMKGQFDGFFQSVEAKAEAAVAESAAAELRRVRRDVDHLRAEAVAIPVAPVDARSDPATAPGAEGRRGGGNPAGGSHPVRRGSFNILKDFQDHWSVTSAPVFETEALRAMIANPGERSWTSDYRCRGGATVTVSFALVWRAMIAG